MQLNNIKNKIKIITNFGTQEAHLKESTAIHSKIHFFSATSNIIYKIFIIDFPLCLMVREKSTENELAYLKLSHTVPSSQSSKFAIDVAQPLSQPLYSWQNRQFDDLTSI
jgi:hypothetical protein